MALDMLCARRSLISRTKINVILLPGGHGDRKQCFSIDDSPSHGLPPNCALANIDLVIVWVPFPHVLEHFPGTKSPHLQSTRTIN